MKKKKIEDLKASGDFEGWLCAHPGKAFKDHLVELKLNRELFNHCVKSCPTWALKYAKSELSNEQILKCVALSPTFGIKYAPEFIDKILFEKILNLYPVQCVMNFPNFVDDWESLKRVCPGMLLCNFREKLSESALAYCKEMYPSWTKSKLDKNFIVIDSEFFDFRLYANKYRILKRDKFLTKQQILELAEKRPIGALMSYADLLSDYDYISCMLRVSDTYPIYMDTVKISLDPKVIEMRSIYKQTNQNERETNEV